jgi:hypothetical protein
MTFRILYVGPASGSSEWLRTQADNASMTTRDYIRQVARLEPLPVREGGPWDGRARVDQDTDGFAQRKSPKNKSLDPST